MDDYSASPKKNSSQTPQDYYYDKSTSFPALNNQTNGQFKESSKDTMTSLGLQGPEMEDLIMNQKCSQGSNRHSNEELGQSFISEESFSTLSIAEEASDHIAAPKAAQYQLRFR